MLFSLKITMILPNTTLTAYFIGILTSILNEHRGKKYESKRIEESLLFCGHFNLPPELRRAVVTHSSVEEIQHDFHHIFVFVVQFVGNLCCFSQCDS